MEKLEENFQNLMREVLDADYYSAQAGTQNGLDGFWEFTTPGLESFPNRWYFECKNLNKKHKGNWGNVEPLKIKDFSDKILQILAVRNKNSYPDVFCVVIPHKQILADEGPSDVNINLAIKTWNSGKFPFKIVIWDFHFLSRYIPNIDHQSCRQIYPNSPNKNYTKQTSSLKLWKEEIDRESIAGKVINLTYVGERDYSQGLVSRQVLVFDIKEFEEKTPSSSEKEFVEFSWENETFKLQYCEIVKCCLDSNYSKFLSTGAKHSAVDTEEPEISAPEDEIQEEKKFFDETKYQDFVKNKKKALLELFEKDQIGKKMIWKITTFINENNSGMVIFRYNGDLSRTKLVNLPLYCFVANDFGGEDQNIIFHIKEHI